MTESLKERCNKRWLALKSERSSWMGQWRDISEVLLPRSGRFLVDENNKGDKGYRHILDGTGTRALRTLAGGMMAGLTSPARPWFRLTTLNPELDEDYEVKAWLSQSTEKLQMVFNRSNVYRSLHTAYEELGAFGTSATIILDDFDRVIHCMPLTIGEYCITANARGRVNSLYREFRLTAEMMAAEFGYANCSSAVQSALDQGNYDAWFHVVNAIEPRDLRNPSKLDNKNMAYRSVYFEPQADGDKLLRESGFNSFPVLGARWLVTGGDIYGTSPGMEAVGGLRSLQANQLAADRAVEYQANPPIVVPTDLKDDETDILPGGITYADNVGQAQIIKPLFDGANFRVDALQMKIQDTRQLINEAFYKDIFLMLTEQGGNRMTATEVAERHEEKMLMLGPVLDRLNTEMLDPLISLAFERLLRAGALPEVPEPLQGVELNVEYTSILAQSQKAITTNAVDRFTNNLGVIAGMKPEVLDKFDADYWADYYADALGVDPRLIVPGKQVALIRQQRAQAQQEQQQAQQAQQQSEVVRNLGGLGEMQSMAPQEIQGMFSGY